VLPGAPGGQAKPAVPASQAKEFKKKTL